MKRSILIIIGIVIILLLAAVWVYLLFFDKGEVTELFGDLNIAPAGEELPIDTPPEETEDPDATELAIDNNPLQQLTTRPVIGYRHIPTEQPHGSVVYAEEGSGHVYEIVLDTSEENRVSKTTIPNASGAVFSASGTEAVIVSGDAKTEAFLGQLLKEEEKMDLRSIPAAVQNLHTGPDAKVFFTEEDEERTVGRVLNLSSLNEKVLFTLPFTSASIAWGPDESSAHYAFPRAAARLPGYVYEATDTGIESMSISGFGLTALYGSDYILTSYTNKSQYLSKFINITTGDENPAPLTLLIEKCAFVPFTDDLYCGANFSPDENDELPDDWYRGEITIEDSLWRVDPEAGVAELISDLTSETGRTIDVIDLKVSDDGEKILFTNKIDNTLWLYDLGL